MTSDPWKELAVPSATSALSARRVSSECCWNFFWARSLDNRCLLILAFSQELRSGQRPPRLRGIDVLISKDGDGDGQILSIKLLDAAQRDIFFRLCLDIVAATKNASSEAEAVDLTLARTWRWHHLLRGGGDDRLSPEEQKGVIGELLVLEDILFPVLSMRDSLSAWHGPLGAPKDFEIDRIAIEAKARRGAATPYVMISSEHQLETEGTDIVFLFVCELDKAQTDSADGFSLPDIAKRVLDLIRASDQAASDHFESLLGAIGFRWEDDYSDSLWLRGADRIFIVAHDFPRITPGHFRSGVSNVRYSISLADCAMFSTTLEFAAKALSGGLNGD